MKLSSVGSAVPDRRAALVAVPQRHDLVQHRGRLTLVNAGLTPREAMIEDLLFLRAALDEAGIDYLLARGAGEGERPVLAVDERDRDAATAALAAACRTEPFYSRTAPTTSARGAKHGRRAPVLLSTGSLGGRPGDRAFVLYRPRVTPGGTLRFGARSCIRLEFWARDGVDIVLPEETAVTRSRLPEQEAVATTVERYGESWPTVAGMWDVLARDIDFPIDIVFSWVDGTDLEWQRARASRMQSYVIGEGDDHEARFRQLDELRYALRSVHLFAPWIRNIVIVTDSPRPEWLADHPRVAVLSSAEFFADSSVLPVYNSHAVESQLHRIPGLSEHFLYSNDDMFFGREVGPEAFFSSGGVSRFIEADTRIGLGDPETSRSGFENAARVNRALLQGRFGRTIARHLEHAPAPLRRSVLEELEAEFPAEFARTASSRFRSATDVSVTNSLYHYYALMTGRAVPQESMRVKYVDTTMRAGVAELGALLRRRDHDFFCLNDGSFPELTPDERAEAVRSFLEDYLPIAAPWERTAR
jgi:hypothetical protein